MPLEPHQVPISRGLLWPRYLGPKKIVLVSVVIGRRFEPLLEPCEPLIIT